MTHNSLTSRSYILDAVALLQEEVATANHLQELAMDAVNGMKLAVNENRDATPWIQDYEKIKKLLGGCINRRRQIMKMLFDSVESGNHNYRCLCKHAISSYQFATECWHANMDNRDRPVICQELYEQLVIILSEFFGLPEIETCGRCFADSLEAKQNLVTIDSNDSSKSSEG